MKDIIREFVETWKQNYIAYYTEQAEKADEVMHNPNTEIGYTERRSQCQELLGKVYARERLFRSLKGFLELVRNDAEREGERKYRQMVARVTNVGGAILDQGHLEIGYDGSINGWVACENGHVSVETIFAGGYNDGVIVNERHGQRLHYRVLTHLYKEAN